ncbi:MAG: hypothetical protein J5J06_14620 [Phycisphaerae bacterium]|nr:hypothetical protein [Phycisphaerae bacterium]
MAQDVRFIVFNPEEELTRPLRALIHGCDSAKIVAEVEEAALLLQAARQFPVDAIVVNLDPNPDAILPAIGELVQETSAAVFATSRSTDGPLILKVMRLGVREFLPYPIEQESLQEAVSRVAMQRVANTASGKLITVMGASGGVGATMLAANLASELADLADGRVTVVDLDYRFGQVATFLDVEPTYTLADLCNSPEQLEPQIVERTLVRHSSGLHVLSRPANFAQAETITAASCTGLLTCLQQMNEYVITDGPIRSDPSARSVLDICDVNLLVVHLLIPSVRNAARIIEAMREGGYNLERTKLICNRTGKESGSLSVEDVSETLGLPVYASVPDEWAAVSGAINLGEALRSHSPKSKARAAIREIAERLHAPPPESDDKDNRKKGLIGRIFAAS